MCAVTEQREPTALPVNHREQHAISVQRIARRAILLGLSPGEKRETVWFRLDGSTGSQLPQVLVAAPDASTKEQRSAASSGFPGKPSSHLVQAKPAIQDG